MDFGAIESRKLQTGTNNFPGTGVGAGPNCLDVRQLHLMASGVEGATFVASALVESLGIDVLSLLDAPKDVMFFESDCYTSLLFSPTRNKWIFCGIDRMCQLLHKIFRFTRGCL